MTRARGQSDYLLASRRQRFEAMFTSHSSAVLAYALRRVEVAEDAADIIAETFLVAWRRIDDVPAGDEARLWLFGVARRVCANHSRGGHRRTVLADRLRGHLATQVQETEIEVEVDDDVARVREAMRRLDDGDRELLEMTSWEGLTPSELGAVLAVPASTVRSRLQRARARFRTQLEIVTKEEQS
ncbi:RNA polymerase sigma factor [Jiangella asiatica]|uniref:RNA polymerase sigma factor n=1 Tax=Jiangella asiatica TaxID=2530372 RepID=A0A4R5CTB4_9ACTN|nr:RNA polymerase sigma factor [Jiangella asiatica]TDE01045.1 RNA polymerase sigma factor [Jiangella asiatica]